MIHMLHLLPWAKTKKMTHISSKTTWDTVHKLQPIHSNTKNNTYIYNSRFRSFFNHSWWSCCSFLAVSLRFQVSVWFVSVARPWKSTHHISNIHIDGFAQDCNNSSALAMELLQSYAKPLIYSTFHEISTVHALLYFIMVGYSSILPKCFWI